MPNFRPLAETKFINDANLVAYYRLDGNSNDVKNGYNGTDSNMSYTADHFGNVGVFNGSSSKIDLPTTSFNTALSTEITISMWIKLSASTNNQYVFALNSVGNDSPEIRIITSYSGGNLTFSWIVYDAGAYQCTITKTIPYDNNWHHIDVVGATNDFRIYVDGVLGGADTSGSFNIDSIGELCLGRYSRSGAYFNGSMDDIAIFSRALSASEVNELYQGMTYGEYLGAGPATTKLLLLLNGNSIDSSGNGNNGVDTDIAWVDGKFGKCASFNGSSSRIDLPSSLFNLTTFTVSAWIKTTAHSANQGYIYEQRNTADNAVCELKVNNTKVRLAIYNGSSELGPLSNKVVNDGFWHNVLATRDGATIKLYIDGSYDNQITNGHTIEIGSDIGSIGRHPAGLAYFNGSIDKVKVENRAWSAEEVKKYYTMTKGRFGII